MAVTFTPNIALAKPTNTELALEWVRNTKLQEDNNLIIIDKMDVNLTAYTPVLTAQTTPPNIGTGNIQGEYCDLQGFVFGNFIIEFLDAGITSGTGEYGVSLPFPADGSFHVVGTALNNISGSNSVIGEGYYWDSSAITTSGSLALDVVTVAGVSYVRMATETYTGKTNAFLANGQPAAVANNDRITGNFFYKRV